MKVYIVTEGEYSAYHIVRVFSDRNMALAFIEATGRSEMNIEPYDMNEETHDKLKCFSVAYIDGLFHIHEHRQELFDYHPNFREVSNCYYYMSWARKFTPKDEVVYFPAVNVIAKDKVHAIKIAQDKFAEYKARKAGII